MYNAIVTIALYVCLHCCSSCPAGP